MLDVEGLTLTPADRALLAEPAVGGLILFSRNYASPSQLADLVAAARAVRKPPLLIAVDHEGGRVQRFRDGFSRLPPMRRLGQHYDNDRAAALELARTTGWLIGAELRASGIDLAFAPCVDLDRGVSEVIGDRAFHRDPAAVGELAAAFCRGMRSAGMAAVANDVTGTAYRASQLGLGDILMAGKTGTAQSRDYGSGSRGPRDAVWSRRDHALFVAFAPHDAPRYAIALIIQHAPSGGSVDAAPRAREVMKTVLLKDPDMRARIERPLPPEPEGPPTEDELRIGAAPAEPEGVVEPAPRPAPAPARDPSLPTGPRPYLSEPPR